MAVRDKILDGLAWAGVEEPVRVAKISAMLVRENGTDSYNRLTKTRIKEAVRNTSPPYGRGKAITEKVEAETARQAEIYTQRQKSQADFAEWLRFMAKMETRLNCAYAHAFGRPRYAPYAYYSGDYSDTGYHDARRAWDEKEQARDKGDECVALTHWQGHVVCLVNGVNEKHQVHIATRRHDGEIVRTYFRDEPEDFAQAAISLGGPKVRAAFALGIRVTTDWVGRTTTVHYTKQRELTLPWQARRYEERPNAHGYVNLSAVPVLISGTSMIDDEDEV